MTEDQLQAQIFQWAWNTYPETRRLLFHIPNGGSRHRLEASKLKAMGVVPGVPDLCFLWKGKSTFFELKTPTGKVSDSQMEWAIVANFHNIDVHVVRTIDDFQTIFINIINA